jgi:hypothetical protein
MADPRQQDKFKIYKDRETIQKYMSSIYRKLGFPKEEHHTVRRQKLRKKYCPVLEDILNYDPANIDSWPEDGVEPEPDPDMTALVVIDQQEEKKEKEKGQSTALTTYKPASLVITEEPGCGSILRRVFAILIRAVVAIIVFLTVAIIAFLIGRNIPNPSVLATVIVTATPSVTVEPTLTEEIPTATLKVTEQTAAVTATPPAPTDTLLPAATPTNTPTPTLTSTPVPPPEFYEPCDTETGLRPEWEGDTSKWSCINDQLVTISNDAELRIGHEEWRNYAVEVTLVWNGYSIGPCEISILVAKNQKRLTIVMDASGLGEVWTEWSRDGDVIPNGRIRGLRRPYTLRIVTQGSLIMTNVGDKEISMNLPGHDHGSIILRCQLTGSVLDDFRVSPLP